MWSECGRVFPGLLESIALTVGFVHVDSMGMAVEASPGEKLIYHGALVQAKAGLAEEIPVGVARLSLPN